GGIHAVAEQARNHDPQNFLLRQAPLGRKVPFLLRAFRLLYSAHLIAENTNEYLRGHDSGKKGNDHGPGNALENLWRDTPLFEENEEECEGPNIEAEDRSIIR